MGQNKYDLQENTASFVSTRMKTAAVGIDNGGMGETMSESRQGGSEPGSDSVSLSGSSTASCSGPDTKKGIYSVPVDKWALPFNGGKLWNGIPTRRCQKLVDPTDVPVDRHDLHHQGPSLWRFRNIVVVSATSMLYTVFLFVALFLWMSNRQWHWRAKKHALSTTSTVGVKDKNQNRIAGGRGGDNLESETDEDDNGPSTEDHEKDENLDGEAKKDFRLKVTEARRRKSLASLLQHETEIDSDDEEYRQNCDGDLKSTGSEGKREITTSPLVSSSSDTASSPDERETQYRNRRRAMRDDLMDVVSKIKVFSYLSEDAFIECMRYMEYVDLPYAGTVLFGEGTSGKGQAINDGSLYAVVSGNVMCSYRLLQNQNMTTMGLSTLGGGSGGNNPCSNGVNSFRSSTQAAELEDEQVDGQGDFGEGDDDDALLLRFSAGPGDIVTSLLTMLSGLVRQHQLREEQSGEGDGSSAQLDGPSALGVNSLFCPPSNTSLELAHGMHAVAAVDGTRLVRVPARCFLAMLDQFPHDVHRITQTVLCRMERVTMQTLVKSLGLGVEVLWRASLTQPLGRKKCWKVTQDSKPAFLTKKEVIALAETSKEWQRITMKLRNRDDEETKNTDKLSAKLVHQVKRDAATVASVQLGLGRTPECIDFLSRKSEIISLPIGETLTHTGIHPNAVYLLLRGHLDVLAAAPVVQTPVFKKRGRYQSNSGNVLPSNDLTSYKGTPSPSSFRLLFIVQPGQLIGRLAGLTGDVSTVTIRHGDDSAGSSKSGDGLGGTAAILLRIPIEALDFLLANYPGALIRSLDYVLNDLLSPVTHILDMSLEWIHVQAGEALVQQGDKCDSLFIVLNGRLRAVWGGSGQGGGKEEYGRGACIGEVEVLTGVAWPADVYAIRNSELARMPMSVLRAIIHMYPQAGLHFARIIASQVLKKQRQRYGTSNFSGSGSTIAKPNLSTRGISRGIIRTLNTQTGVDSSPGTPAVSNSILPSYGLNLATIAVVPLTSVSLDASVDTSYFCSALTRTLNTIAPTKLMTKAVVRGRLGDNVFFHRNAMHDLKMTRLLGDMEENHRLVVYQADYKYTWWTRLCVQQADCVLLLVRSDNVPEKKRVEQCLGWAYHSLHVRIELVVLHTPAQKKVCEAHKDDDENKSTYNDDDASEAVHVKVRLNKWSEERPWIKGQHIIRLPLTEHRMDMHRLCRRVTGRSVGLVLGGGGARGLAHLGVIRALSEAGITVDMVGGTSQGAFVGALYARSPDRWDLLLKTARQMAETLSDMREKLLDLTLPLTSFFSGKRFNDGIVKSLGKATQIEDLVLNFFCVSTDVCNSIQVVHRKGPCWKYVRASMSLQGYLPPICDNGRLLLDGGYMNVLPADVMMHQMGANTIVAVDVGQETAREYYDYGSHLSGWWMLWNSWNPFVQTVKIPSMGDLSEKLAWISARQHKKNLVNAIDLYLHPPVGNYGTLEYDKFDEIVDKGYQYAKPIVQEWLEENPLLRCGNITEEWQDET